MARSEQKVAQKKSKVQEILPFTKINYQILAAGLLAIVLGYIALAQEPWDGILPLVIAPILLVLGYCIIIPFGIIYRQKPKTDVSQPEATSTQSSISV